MKLTLVIGAYLSTNLPALIYEKDDPSNEPNRPHISSDIVKFKERGDKTKQDAPYTTGAPRLVKLRFSSPLPVPCVPVCVPQSVSARPVRGVLRLVSDSRKGFFTETSSFFKKPIFHLKT